MLGARALLTFYRASRAAQLSPSLSCITACSACPQSTVADTPALKTKLRELYKRVHPDLFHDFPMARDSNEHSFKLLQEYLDSARKGGKLGCSAGVAYRFLFYLRKDDAASAADTSQQDPEDELQRVDLVLPPPARLDAGAAEGALPLATQRALARLLKACGLSGDFVGGAELAGPSRLREFMPGAAELARQRQMTQRGPRHELGTLRTALRLGRQVTVGFAPDVVRAGAAAQAPLLARLAGALDRVAHLDLRGVRFMLGHEYGVDAQGRLWLDMADSALMWTGYLHAVDVEECHQRQATVAQQQRLEAAVAAATGLAMVYSVPSLRLKPALTRFLEGLAAAAAAQGPIGGDRFRNVPLCVVDGQVAGDGSKEGERLSMDATLGFLSATVDASARAVYDYIQGGAGDGVLEVLSSRKAQHEREADLQKAVERRLGLRRLAQDPILSHDRFCSACMRLLHNADVLRPLLDGLEVRISEVNLVAPDGAHIDIAWDFQI